MNYRHIYHAGNKCDVVKHASLTALLRRYGAKEKPFCVMDTHAGTGLYDLASSEAQATREAEAGIGALFRARASDLPESLAAYLSFCQSLNPPGVLRFYPGSPLIARHFLRADDRMICCEKHEADAQSLRRTLAGEKRAETHGRDGYEALGALLPPRIRRGFVLIDPPFEEPGEFDRLWVSLSTIVKRWPQAAAALWYPIKDRPAVWAFHEKAARLGLPDLTAAEMLFEPGKGGGEARLIGSGLLLLNAPWKLQDELESLYTHLAGLWSLPDGLQTSFCLRLNKPSTGNGEPF
jgi:23S rRNA (adenine2030-N6)-methyltransferase